MNKLLFILEVQFGEDITLIANNHLDLEDYLTKTYDWYVIIVNEETVKIKMCEGYAAEYAQLKWVTMV